jgi:hypothetical protein
MRLDSFDVERGEGKRIPSPGMCIYCASESPPLSEEHVIPYALAANSIILEGSCCSACQTTIQKYEQRVLRDQLGVFRTRIGSPTRNRKQRPKSSRLHFIEVNDKAEFIRDLGSRTVPIADAPLAFSVWDSAPPRILGHRASHDAEIGRPWTYVHKERAMQIAREVASETGSEHVACRVDHVNREHFLRFVAKTAHAYAVAELGTKAFRPLLGDIILNRDNDISALVGGDPSGDTVPFEAAQMVTAVAGKVGSGPAAGYTVVRLHFYPLLGTPAQLAVVGAPI